MRIDSVRLCWFRGAAAEVKLAPQGGSMFIYGANGAGKSSFVDAVEVCVKGGKVAHLAHEYAGRHQERGLINTHRPSGKAASVKITMAQTGDWVSCTWGQAGAAHLAGTDKVRLGEWDYRRIALRQEEVADFIRATKSEKYSALVPLLGLQPLENAAENLRRIAKEIGTLSKIEDLRKRVATTDVRREASFGNADDTLLQDRLKSLLERYAARGTSDRPASVEAVLSAIEERLGTLDTQSRQAADLQKLAGNKIPALIAAARTLATEIARLAEPLIRERIAILNAAAVYSADIPDEQEVICPACGSAVRPEDFKAHITAERDRLQAIDDLVRRHHEAIGAVCDEVHRLRELVLGKDLAKWQAAQRSTLADAFRYLGELNFQTLRTACQESDLNQIETELGKVIKAAIAAAATAPPDIKELIKDKEQAETLKDVFATAKAAIQIKRIEALIGFINRVEELVRQEIRDQAQRVFGAISSDIQRLWDILHPGQQITNVRLHVPGDADKAIDVALQFYGVEQESPRLTLSEGQRNALGLCIFLAMAKQGGDATPIILDDVVISMDRGHRSQVAALLEREFLNRQIILFTHEREWFFELSRFLRRPTWTSARLLPWSGPETGIRIADQAEDFAKARSKVLTDPEDAESNVRRIMDQALAEIAERLEVPVPFLRGDENDHRTAGQFIIRVASRAQKAMYIRSTQQDPSCTLFAKHTAAPTALHLVAPQLVAWANRATHTFSASPSEAAAVIDNCEAALQAFHCNECAAPVWFARIEDEKRLECRCGKLQWRL